MIVLSSVLCKYLQVSLLSFSFFNQNQTIRTFRFCLWSYQDELLACFGLDLPAAFLGVVQAPGNRETGEETARFLSVTVM